VIHGRGNWAVGSPRELREEGQQPNKSGPLPRRWAIDPIQPQQVVATGSEQAVPAQLHDLVAAAP